MKIASTVSTPNSRAVTKPPANGTSTPNVPASAATRPDRSRSRRSSSSPAKVRQQLTEYGLVAEEYGGDVI